MSAIIGHDEIQRDLRALAESADPPHALLFSGPDRTGRRALAYEYARLLNCEQAPGAVAPGLFAAEPGTADWPCGACRACHLITEGAHPDVIVVSPGDTLCRPRAGDSSHAKHPDSRDIRICQVRGIVDLASRYPFEARSRVIVIDPAERFAHDAGHTLLKTLEEPPGHTVFVLITAAPDALLETLRSRCRRVDVRPVARRAIVGGLLARGVTEDIAEAAATAARGRPGQALAFAHQPDLLGDRERLRERCSRLAAAGAGERLKYAEDLAERGGRDRATLLTELDAWESYWEESLRESAAGETDAAAPSEALRAIWRTREDLLANVQRRIALDLMILSFPRRTLAVASEDSSASNG